GEAIFIGKKPRFQCYISALLDCCQHRFRHINSRASHPSAGGLTPEVVLMTSHDGLSSFKFMSGIFRSICLNGLIVGNVDSSVNIRHVGCKEDEVIDAVFKILESSSEALSTSLKMRSVQLSQIQKFEYAEEAFKLRFDENKFINFSPANLLLPKRFEDKSNDLFTTFNIVQENLIRGGLRAYTRNNIGELTRVRTRAIGTIDDNLKINKGLWELSRKYLESAT
ncbi:MAG: DUF945 domain-containing protein, partial [Silvanigrellaceae bacterium]|nr:DUF945 domain-containing protein [Silvanigrellaceae bacterium]